MNGQQVKQRRNKKIVNDILREVINLISKSNF